MPGGHLLTLCNPAASLLLRVSRKLVNKAADAAFLMNLGQFTEPRLLVPQLVNEWREGVISELSQHLENAGRVLSHVCCVPTGSIAVSDQR